MSLLKQQEGYFGMDLNSLNRGQRTRVTYKRSSPCPNFRTPPAGGRLGHDVRFNVHKAHIQGGSLVESGFEPRPPSCIEIVQDKDLGRASKLVVVAENRTFLIFCDSPTCYYESSRGCADDDFMSEAVAGLAAVAHGSIIWGHVPDVKLARRKHTIPPACKTKQECSQLKEPTS
ncbi:hypothetical protein AVEN_76527-1 [Araneus ventricosus]|uniref:Uncharacterized protein n=1 Tax=Araneus ventricosus TaxID=182803 RepID=A0A4Y2CF48_ARAVE|nr:hypothetical protein AVEN_76527-1 [Araneus ventricosus]